MKQNWGGTLDFEYQHEKYWKELIKMTEERRERWKKRWRELGSSVGTREWKYKQSDEYQEGVSLESVDTGIEETGDDSCDHRLHSPSTWVVVDDIGKSSGTKWFR